ncbi:MAG: thymidylate synthase [Patescibacteria group bacterium]
MKSSNAVKNTLEGAWLQAIRTAIQGNKVDDSEPFLEIRNLEISYANAFEIETPQYIDLFGSEYLDYMRRIYSPSGDPATGRNYYALMRAMNGIDQVSRVIERLQAEPLTRSATIILADPNSRKQPCVSEINFAVRNGQISMNVIFKSSDLAKKFIPDMVELSAVHAEIARSLQISRGQVTAFILSAQLYDADLPKITDAIKRLKESSYFKASEVRDNWDKEAETWDTVIKDPSHYVNIEDGYSRFLDFIEAQVPDTKSGNSELALDSGCGTGVIAKQLNTKGYQVVAVDISPRMLEHADKDSSMRHYILANSLDLPYEDEYFNLVCSRGVLISHVGKAYVNLFIKEHSRVLKNNGLFIFDFITHFEPDEARQRRRKAYMTYGRMVQNLKKEGFEVIARAGDDSHRVNAVVCRKSNATI